MNVSRVGAQSQAVNTKTAAAVVLTVTAAAALIGLLALPPQPAAPTVAQAVCTTDADCAAWEARQQIPAWYRTNGAPAPAPEPCSPSTTTTRGAK